MPTNVKTRSEIFEGYGMPELWRTLLIVGICGILTFIYYLSGGEITTCIVIMLSVIAGSIMFTVKDRNNLSVVDQIGFMIHFAKSQKQYRYIYLDEWEV